MSVPIHAIPLCSDERTLLALACALGARTVPGLAPAEERLTRRLPVIPTAVIETTRTAILRGEDPLGELFCLLRTPELRREQGAVYTPQKIVDAMIEWAAGSGPPARVVDPGTGSGRFLVSAARRFTNASLLGVELDPVAALLARGHLAAAGFSDRAEVVLKDYRSLSVPKVDGKTLYIGNPPYVRHHLIESKWKRWLVSQANNQRVAASRLAGLHVYFFFATLLNATRGDFGIFITAAEWLDVNYGRLVRQLFLGSLGGVGLVVVEPTAQVFPDTAVTAAITSFVVGSETKSVRIKRVDSIDKIGDVGRGRRVLRERLQVEQRWSRLTRTARKIPDGLVELGELCRVHRGQVTGSNRVWISGPHSKGLPLSVLFPTVTRAKEIIDAGEVLDDGSALRLVIDLPADLSLLDRTDRDTIEKFLLTARTLGADKGYIAKHRRPWWSVGLRPPAPIIATYMARRPPAFVQNIALARHINIAHGLYPREYLSALLIRRLVHYLSTAVSVRDGRTYSGGLTKFEPREMERLLVPTPALLAQSTVHA